ncbi:GTP-binding protein gtr2 [Hanseniaspora osmophila]
MSKYGSRDYTTGHPNSKHERTDNFQSTNGIDQNHNTNEGYYIDNSDGRAAGSMHVGDNRALEDEGDNNNNNNNNNDNDNDNDVDGDTEATHATVLLMGLRRCGKSSICKVVFHNMQPLDTLYLESTSKPTVTSNKLNKNLINLSIMELPGQLNFFEPNYDHEKIFKKVGALIYIIDSQDEYLNAITNLAMIVEYAYKINPRINIEVLIHKIDGLNEDFKLDTQRDIMQRVGDELLDLGIDNQNGSGISINFYLTSIFDHSIYEALSRIVQKLIPELPFLENMLDNLVLHSDLEKAFLFDINSKIYVSTDSSPVDIQTYEVCSEFVDVTLDLEDLYCVNLDSQQHGGRGQNKLDKDKEIMSFSKLNNGLCIYMKEMVRGLALVALVRLKNEDTTNNANSGAIQSSTKTINEYLTVIDYNVEIFKKSLEQIWKTR